MRKRLWSGVLAVALGTTSLLPLTVRFSSSFSSLVVGAVPSSLETAQALQAEGPLSLRSWFLPLPYAAVHPPFATRIPLPRIPVLKLPPRSNLFWSGAVAPEHRPPWPMYQLALARAHALRPYVLVFVFHQVCPADWSLRNGPDFITPARLAQDLAFFRSHRIATLTAEEFLSFLDGKSTVPSGSVFLAFDNGLEGVYRYAYPIVRKDHAHITLFLIGGRLRSSWWPGDRYLSWSQVRRMVRSGFVDAESETFDLHHLQRISPTMVGPAMLRTWDSYPRGHWEPMRRLEERIWQGLLKERATLRRHLGSAPTLLVWPFSTYTPLAEVEAREAGYRAAFAVYPGIVTRHDNLDRYALPRNPATYMWDNVPKEYEVLTRAYNLGPLLANQPTSVNRTPVVTLGTTRPPIG